MCPRESAGERFRTGIEARLSIFYKSEFDEDEIKNPIGLNCEYLEQFKDGASEDERVGVAEFFSRKISVILTV